ncbi:PH domain-containing protein [Streptomonospora wellingtoniae]|uniref:PH domain-containing protein n=1 Tax=Streptomonospora wellingtoniae TaxID=3075544 RepID=A0ABU2KTQ7_9ACTN|nr:PH domain-containing protein [Streptomonospora sp. DSM 45055]MDT0302676.1 PH domain-containing protein [Streptomonospora sp. DSM 45055]
MNSTGPAAAARTAGVIGDARSAEGWRRLHPLTVWACVLVLGAIFVPGAAAGAVATGLAGALWPWGALIAAGSAASVALVTAAEWLRWHRTRYRVTGERLEIRSGVLVTAHRSVPRDRIRSVDVAVPIWLRPLGLCKVTAGTGQSTGAGGDEIRLEYVLRAEGDRLRAGLLLRAAEAAPGRPREDGGLSGAGHAVRELARLRPVWFGFAPLSAATPALGAAALGAVFNLLSMFGQQRANGIVVGVYDQLAARPPLVLPAVAAVLFTGALAATAVQVDAWWGYRLDREPDGTLRLRRGLVTNTSLSLEERRLRGVELREALPLRWFGAARVRAVATGLGAAEGKGGAVPRSALSPDMPRRRALRLSAEVVRTAESPIAAPLRAHPRAALRRRLVRALAGTAVLAAAAAVAAAAAERAAGAIPLLPAGPLPLADGGAGPGAVTAAAVGALVGALAGGLLLVPWGVSAYRGLGHDLTRGFLVVRKGALLRATVALRREGIIGWRIARTPFQRRAGLATVWATTAAGRGRYAAADVKLGAGLRLADEAVPGLLAQFLEQETPGPAERGGGKPHPARGTSPGAGEHGLSADSPIGH